MRELLTFYKFPGEARARAGVGAANVGARAFTCAAAGGGTVGRHGQDGRVCARDGPGPIPYRGGAMVRRLGGGGTGEARAQERAGTAAVRGRAGEASGHTC